MQMRQYGKQPTTMDGIFAELDAFNADDCIPRNYTISVHHTVSTVFFGTLKEAKERAEVLSKTLRVSTGQAGHLCVMLTGDDTPAAYKEYNSATRKHYNWTR